MFSMMLALGMFGQPANQLEYKRGNLDIVFDGTKLDLKCRLKGASFYLATRAGMAPEFLTWLSMHPVHLCDLVEGAEFDSTRMTDIGIFTNRTSKCSKWTTRPR